MSTVTLLMAGVIGVSAGVVARTLNVWVLGGHRWVIGSRE